MSRARKIEIIAEIPRENVAEAIIKTAKRVHQAITKQTAQVPRDQQAKSFHPSARKLGIILQGWTT